MSVKRRRNKQENTKHDTTFFILGNVEHAVDQFSQDISESRKSEPNTIN